MLDLPLGQAETLFVQRLFLFLFTLGQVLSGQAVKQPNIVIIMADDMGFSDIGCYGSEIKTPVLDELAKKGLRFTQFYNTSRCCPTRASLLTGMYQHQAGIGLMTGDNKLPGYRGELGRDVVTIAEALSMGGYQRYMSGKWHVTKHTRPEDLRITGHCSGDSKNFMARLLVQAVFMIQLPCVEITNLLLRRTTTSISPRSIITPML